MRTTMRQWKKRLMRITLLSFSYLFFFVWIFGIWWNLLRMLGDFMKGIVMDFLENLYGGLYWFFGIFWGFQGMIFLGKNFWELFGKFVTGNFSGISKGLFMGIFLYYRPEHGRDCWGLSNFKRGMEMLSAELSTGRMDPRVGPGHDFAGFWRVRSAFGFFSFSLIISWYLNRCESSNTTFGLIDFLRNSI